ncbi:DUF4395 domain-containing protein [Paenibacillus contaminans]|uniref:DUF4395 domain-containing protein n=1 Tax=Paenibacillus contaminans TaxID=450362 RepID=A0A329MGS5_9BACL|nr:DUF4395 domain-containing protein [Paenibacillus contaminans]RAV19151.1 DUF4395 domain-containing protein [Paenibacillus contaminans]
MNTPAQSIPRPLIRTNQWVIVISVLLTWLTGYYWILAIPLLSGISGVCFDFNPVMRFAKLFLRKHPSAYIPEDKDQQQFNQLMAIGFLTLALVSYLLDWTTAAYVFTIMVAIAAFVAILGFCVGCFIQYQWKMFRARRQQ